MDPTYQTPRERFAADERSRDIHAKLIARSDFRIALDVAMAQYTHDALCGTTDNPAAVAYRLEGAKQFALTILSLSRPPSTRSARDTINLPNTD